MFHVKQRRMDYHLHTIHSFDGRQTVQELCEAMMRQGVEEICLTEHIEPGHPDASVDVPPLWDVWMQEIQAMQKAYPLLTIRAGVEIGDNPARRQETQNLLQGLSLDYHLLSLHLVHGVDCYDAEHYYGGKTRQQAYRDYLEAKAESVLAWNDFDSVAHIGYVCRYAPYDRTEKPLRYEDAPDALDAIFRKLIQEGKALEVNTSGYDAMGDYLPAEGLLRRYMELGGELFTFGSDSHDAARDYERIEDAKAYVRSLGKGYQASFRGRKMTAWAI